jgi:hypothetical protein
MSKFNRSRTTNDPLRVRAPGRSARSRRLRDLFRGYMAKLDQDDPIAQAAALTAAELRVGAEDARARLLAGQPCAEDVVRLENAARRAERDVAALVPEKKAWWEQETEDDQENDS